MGQAARALTALRPGYALSHLLELGGKRREAFDAEQVSKSIAGVVRGGIEFWLGESLDSVKKRLEKLNGLKDAP